MGLAVESGPSRAQSVFDFTEVDFRFARHGFAEGDDADFMAGLRVHDGHRYTSQQTRRHEPPFAIHVTVVLEGERERAKHAGRVDEIKPMGLQVRSTFGL